ncbi:hypothetical protein B566_EDAN001179 [Ephemera danica]|nr:hypothetical protein B566_EDAN001179 [Ephemera danica]
MFERAREASLLLSNSGFHCTLQAMEKIMTTSSEQPGTATAASSSRNGQQDTKKGGKKDAKSADKGSPSKGKCCSNCDALLHLLLLNVSVTL